jgi:predicted acylesterase/phospholipase RssA
VRSHGEQATDPPEQRQEQRKLAVALSGGGHRACLFAIGVLLYLVDVGRNRDVTSIASVSGGSLTNGVVAQSLDFTSTTPEELESALARLVSGVTQRGTLFGDPLTKAYVVLLALGAIVVAVGPWLLPLSFGLQILAFVLAILALAKLAGLRGRVCARAFAKTLFTPEGAPDRLDSICDKLDHVFCATNLHGGEYIYFSQAHVDSYRFGRGVPADVKLSTVVQASAAFPGAFPAVRLPTARHDFSKPRQAESGILRKMALVDGGVYANTPDQWIQRYQNLPPWLHDQTRIRNATECIAVNSSARIKWSSLRWLRLPLVGELLALRRDVSILYNSNNSLRQQGLVSRFMTAERDGKGVRGALVDITQSPFKVPNAWKRAEGPKGSRARAVLAALHATGDDPEGLEGRWEQVTRESSAVPTTLLTLDPALASRLLHHAYVLAMANLHVILDYPLLAVPDASRFDRLVQSGDTL